MLRIAVVSLIDRMWSKKRLPKFEPPARGNELLLELLQNLAPKDDNQCALKAQDLNIAFAVGQTRWLQYAQMNNSIPVPILMILESLPHYRKVSRVAAAQARSSKIDEAIYVCNLLEAAGLPVNLVDLSTKESSSTLAQPSSSDCLLTPAAEIAAHHPQGRCRACWPMAMPMPS
jgi:hypothetical protein